MSSDDEDNKDAAEDAPSVLLNAHGGFVREYYLAARENRPLELQGVVTRANVDTQRKGGASLLHVAADYDAVEAARLLLELGADPNITERATPLHWACADNSSEAMLFLLLEYGANPSARLKDGRTPLDKCRSEEAEKRLAGAVRRLMGRLASALDLYLIPDVADIALEYVAGAEAVRTHREALAAARRTAEE